MFTVGQRVRDKAVKEDIGTVAEVNQDAGAVWLDLDASPSASAVRALYSAHELELLPTRMPTEQERAIFAEIGRPGNAS